MFKNRIVTCIVGKRGTIASLVALGLTMNTFMSQHERLHHWWEEVDDKLGNKKISTHLSYSCGTIGCKLMVIMYEVFFDFA